MFCYQDYIITLVFTESTKNETHVLTLPQQANAETGPSIDDATLDANVKVVSDLQGLESDLSDMMTDTRKDLKECDIAELQFYLDDLFGIDEFRKCHTIDEVLRKLRRDHIDTFNITYLEQLISRYHQSEAIVKKIKEYNEKKEEFLSATTVKEFQQAVVSKAETVIPKGMAAVTIKIPKEYGFPRTMKDVEELAKKGFKGHHKDFVKINVQPASIIITWYVLEALCGEIVQLARENAAVLREEGVEEVSIVGKKSVTLSTKDGQEVRILQHSLLNHIISFLTCRSTRIVMVIQIQASMSHTVQYITTCICPPLYCMTITFNHCSCRASDS